MKLIDTDDLEALRAAWQPYTQANVDRMEVKDIAEEIAEMAAVDIPIYRRHYIAAGAVKKLERQLFLDALKSLYNATTSLPNELLQEDPMIEAMAQAEFIIGIFDEAARKDEQYEE